ncbi:MAG: hypothetical protein ABFD62_00965 [Syntrophaceae bacterium]
MKRILIINTNRNHFPLPVIPVGACMTAQAAREAGHEARMLDLTFEADPLRRIYDEINFFDPHIAGLSISSARASPPMRCCSKSRLIERKRHL